MVKFKKPATAPGKEQLLSYHLHKLLAHKRPHRSLEYIHASDVTKPDFCARRLALMEETGKKGKPDFTTTAMKLVWYMGERLEAGVQRWATQIGIAIGDWQCGMCEHITEFCSKPKLCLMCAHSKFSYVQVRPVSQDSGISAGLDLLVKLPGIPKYRIIECKSYDKDKFQSLVSPLAEHRDRTRLYMRVASEDGSYAEHIDTEMAHVLYISKGGFGEKTTRPRKECGLADGDWTPFKEFMVAGDHKLAQQYSDKARPLWLWKNGQAGRPDPICATGFDKCAQNCEMLQECFSGKYPPGK